MMLKNVSISIQLVFVQQEHSMVSIEMIKNTKAFLGNKLHTFTL